MTKVILNKFDGGLAETKYPVEKNVAAAMTHCDIVSDRRLLKNLRRNEKDTVSGGAHSGTEAVYCLDGARRSDGKIIGIGYTSSVSTTARFLRKNSDDVTSYWQQSSVTCGNTPYYNGAILFKDNVYCLSYSGSSQDLYRYDGDSTATSVVSSWTESNVSGYGNVIPKPIVHPLDNKLYIAMGKSIFVWDGSAGTITTASVSTPYQIVGLTYYGTYIAIACIMGNGKSIVYFWGRDTTVTTFQDSSEFGDDKLCFIANLNGTLIGVSTRTSASTYLDYKLKIRALIGRESVLVKEIELASTQSAITGYYTVWKDVIYFLNQPQNSPYGHLFAIHKNKAGEIVLSQSRSSQYEGETSTFTSHFFNIHDYFFFVDYNNGKIMRTYSAYPLYNSTDSTYTFPINAGIEYEDDRAKLKTISSVYVKAYANSAGYGTLKLEVSIDGGAYTTIFSETSPSGKNAYVVEALGDSVGDALGEGRDIQFKVTFDQGIDIVELGYDYEEVSTTI
jgi:hypothetical protein